MFFYRKKKVIKMRTINNKFGMQDHQCKYKKTAKNKNSIKKISIFKCLLNYKIKIHIK